MCVQKNTEADRLVEMFENRRRRCAAICKKVNGQNAKSVN